MDKITQYKQTVSQIITELATEIRLKDLENLLILDDERGHYLFFMDGWRNGSRQYGCVIHVEVKDDGKIWLRRDGTDLDIGQQLLDAQIPKNDIVLGFHSPKMRELSDFAVA
jgi:hypothetical protein